MSEARRFIPLGAMLAGMVLVQLATSITGTGYLLTQLTMSAYYGFVIAGLCLLMGYAGQISIGHAAFFAIGGYTAAVVTTRNLSAFASTPAGQRLSSLGMLIHSVDLYGRHTATLTPWISLLLAVAITVALAYLIAVPVLKLRGHYLAMATLGFGVIIYRVLLGGRLFGEADGIANVASFTLLPGLTIGGARNLRILNFYLAWGMLLCILALCVNLIHSRVGRALTAIHGNEEAAAAMGVATSRYKQHVFVLSAVFAALGGVLLTHYNGGIGPSEASAMKSVRYVAIVAVGGMANVWSVISWGLLLNFLSLRGYFGTYDDAVFGLVLVGVMLFAPNGILRSPLAQRVRALLVRKGAPHGPA